MPVAEPSLIREEPTHQPAPPVPGMEDAEERRLSTDLSERDEEPGKRRLSTDFSEREEEPGKDS